MIRLPPAAGYKGLRRSKYHTVNNLPGFLDVQNANLFVMYVKARFRIKFEQTGVHISGYTFTTCVGSFDLTLTLGYKKSRFYVSKDEAIEVK
jgi:hypothetical protein